MFEKVKGVGEAIADGLAVATGGYLLWTAGFQQPKIPVFHELIAFFGTAGAMWLTLKVLRATKMTGRGG